MKFIRYCIITLLASSSFCYGFTNDGVKHASRGIGKMGLGLLCAYTGVSAALRTEKSQGEHKSVLLWNLKDFLTQYQQRGTLGVFDEDSLKMQKQLNDVLSSLGMIGLCTYGAYKCTVSACKSFKEAGKAQKNTDHASRLKDSKESLQERLPSEIPQ